MPYTLDGFTLGENVRAAIVARGEPQVRSASAALWPTAGGGSVTVVTADDGTIVIIDVVGGYREKRKLAVPGDELVLGESTHMAYANPGIKDGDACGAGLVGSPCFTFALEPDAELVLDFNGHGELMDLPLSEAILGTRDALRRAGRIIPRMR